mgnify:CR=1 FL=1
MKEEVEHIVINIGMEISDESDINKSETASASATETASERKTETAFEDGKNGSFSGIKALE